MHKRLLRQLLASPSKASGLGHGWRQTAGSGWGSAGLPAANFPLGRTWVQVWVASYALVGRREVGRDVRPVFLPLPLHSIPSWQCHRGDLPSRLSLRWLLLCDVQRDEARRELRPFPPQLPQVPRRPARDCPGPWSHRRPAFLERGASLLSRRHRALHGDRPGSLAGLLLSLTMLGDIAGGFAVGEGW